MLENNFTNLIAISEKSGRIQTPTKEDRGSEEKVINTRTQTGRGKGRGRGRGRDQG